MTDFAELKEKTRELLVSAQAQGLVENHECQRRLTVLDQAQNLAEVEALVSDLMEEAPGLPLDESQLSLSNIMGEQQVAASQLTRNLFYRCIMGKGTLDYREVLFPPGETVLNLKLIMGEVEILLPPGVALRSRLSVVMGDCPSLRGKNQGGEGESWLTLTGRVVMGSLRII